MRGCWGWYCWYLRIRTPSYVGIGTDFRTSVPLAWKKVVFLALFPVFHAKNATGGVFFSTFSGLLLSSFLKSKMLKASTFNENQNAPRRRPVFCKGTFLPPGLGQVFSLGINKSSCVHFTSKCGKKQDPPMVVKIWRRTTQNNMGFVLKSTIFAVDFGDPWFLVIPKSTPKKCLLHPDVFWMFWRQGMMSPLV